MSLHEKKVLSITISGKPNTGVTSALLAIKTLLEAEGFEVGHNARTIQSIEENPDLDYDAVFSHISPRVKIELNEHRVVDTLNVPGLNKPSGYRGMGAADETKSADALVTEALSRATDIAGISVNSVLIRQSRVLVNLYGTDTLFKPVPDNIGELREDGLIMAVHKLPEGKRRDELTYEELCAIKAPNVISDMLFFHKM